MSFASSVNANARKTLYRVNEKVYEISRELFTRIVKLTPSPSNPGPYADGMLVNQWYPEDGRDFSDELGTTLSDNGADSLARIAALNGYQFYGRDGAVTLANNLHYAGLAETYGWQPPEWSGTPGYFMVAHSLHYISSKYK